MLGHLHTSCLNRKPFRHSMNVIIHAAHHVVPACGHLWFPAALVWGIPSRPKLQKNLMKCRENNVHDSLNRMGVNCLQEGPWS